MIDKCIVEKFLADHGVNVYDIPHVTDFERLSLAYESASLYNDINEPLTDEVDIMCSYICYLAALLDRTANHLHNVLLESGTDDCE